MGQRQILLPSLLILLLGFFSTQGTFTGRVVQDTISDQIYDLTDDGLVDGQDLREVMDLASYGVYHKQADFNNDGVIDQLDIDLLAAVLP